MFPLSNLSIGSPLIPDVVVYSVLSPLVHYVLPFMTIALSMVMLHVSSLAVIVVKTRTNRVLVDDIVKYLTTDSASLKQKYSLVSGAWTPSIGWMILKSWSFNIILFRLI